jgi:hypothetical protein
MSYFNRVLEIEGWRTKDTLSDILFPWYTRPFLKELVKWDISDWKVFEYGAGDSTHWWKKHANIVHSVDSNESWARKTSSNFVTNKEQYIKYPISLIDDIKFDCCIIDGEPTEWRDFCTEYALLSLKKGGILIIDNYEQTSVNLSSWPLTNILLKDYEKHVFQEPTHQDWKTAYWIIS